MVAWLIGCLFFVQSTSDFAGTGEKGYTGDGGPASKAKLADPFDVALDTAGNLYFSDTSNHCVRRVDAKTGIITTVAGTGGKKGFAGDDGPATHSLLHEPYGVELDSAGNLYIVDRLNYCIRRVDAKTGTIATVAGMGGKKGYSGDDGPATQALLREPNGIALDGKGKLYIADVADQRVRVVDLKTGTIATFCGTGVKKSAGDGGPIDKATLAGPRALAISADGSVYICEREGNCVRRVNAKTRTISTIAGTGEAGYTGDGGSATKARLKGPKELHLDAVGNLYIVDTENHAIRKVDAQGTITTLNAGKLARPHGVTVGADGTVYIGDTLNHRVRAVWK